MLFDDRTPPRVEQLPALLIGAKTVMVIPLLSGSYCLHGEAIRSGVMTIARVAVMMTATVWLSLARAPDASKRERIGDALPCGGACPISAITSLRQSRGLNRPKPFPQAASQLSMLWEDGRVTMRRNRGKREAEPVPPIKNLKNSSRRCQIGVSTIWRVFCRSLAVARRPSGIQGASACVQ
jgi:hypothetical protein